MNLKIKLFSAASLTMLLTCNALQQAAATELEPQFVYQSLFKKRSDYALYFFVQPGCQYCEAQKKVLATFKSQTDWYIKTIDIIEHPEVRAKFNINGTPVIVLVSKNMDSNGWRAITQGYSPLETFTKDVFATTQLLNTSSINPYIYRGQ